ncbi:protein TWIN LOV 1-like [Lycium ferocissimum]|uniref:protein TWIN LOV 1-like n=1 Tax=Lycium ferocissimum TaxID=112874 RepID=UPI0028151A4A|nr:protein TWIN LOV 1-like [Lycium ferocissimum]XP_059278287.1 protein TWIN LOV 1-like [Lycium ferocissimum]XP_059278288.1 protein TWIN LOV 1-like [Lycium ferocissimum]
MESQRGISIGQSFDCYSAGFQESLDELPDNFTITDPYISGNPIVYASRGFLEMFGYSKYEVIGSNGRIFQGPKTNRRSVLEVREAIREERDIQISLLNYRKDGTPFWMLFHMCPLFDEKDGRVIHFLGVQVPILRRPKPSRLNLCQDGAGCRESVLRCFRREVYSMSVERALSLALGSGLDFTGVDVEGPCDASDLEKRKATTSVNNILTVLVHDGESTGRLVHGKRRSPPRTGLLGASLNMSLGRIKQSFVLTDANLPDMPIVFASDTFLKLTGFSRDEVLGYNCRSLSATDTDSSSQFQIKESIQNEQPCTLRMLNYRKDGTSFWLYISPVRNASGKVAYFVAVEGEDNSETKEKPGMRQRGVVAAVKIAVRGLSMGVRTC